MTVIFSAEIERGDHARLIQVLAHVAGDDADVRWIPEMELTPDEIESLKASAIARAKGV